MVDNPKKYLIAGTAVLAVAVVGRLCYNFWYKMDCPMA